MALRTPKDRVSYKAAQTAPRSSADDDDGFAARLGMIALLGGREEGVQINVQDCQVRGWPHAAAICPGPSPTSPGESMNQRMLIRTISGLSRGFSTGSYERMKTIQEGVPNCRLCAFKEQQQRNLAAKSIDLYSAAQRKTHAENKDNVVQAERLLDLASAPSVAPNWRWCERLGDSIIALHAPKRTIIVPADRAFEAFGKILNKEARRLPFLAALKKQLSGEDNPS